MTEPSEYGCAVDVIHERKTRCLFTGGKIRNVRDHITYKEKIIVGQKY